MKVSVDEATALTGVNAARSQYNVSGENISVAIIDSGIDNSHPDLDDIVAERDFTGDETPTIAEDPNGHGTHVAGIVASDGTANDGKYVGVAPNASLIDARVVGADGMASTSDVIRAMNWSITQGADVLSISIGGPAHRLRSNGPYTAAVQQATARNVSVVIAAGNQGSEYGTVQRPGIVKDAITVGAVDKNRELAYFSSRGPTPAGLFLKPDVVAPGVNIVSTASSDAGYTASYVSQSGTSMATPVVSGIVALVRQKHPNWTSSRVKNAIVSSANPLAGSNVYEQGGGVVNATQAVDPELVVAPAVLDFGSYESNTTATRVIKLRNTGSDARTVNLTVSGSMVRGSNSPNVSLNRTHLHLRANESAAVAVTINTSTTPGVYGGRIQIENTSIAGMYGFARTNELRIDKRALGNGSVKTDSVTILSDSSGSFDVFRSLTLENGSASVPIVKIGGYTVISTGVDEETGQPVVTTVHTTVNGSTTVVLNESATARYALNVSNVEHPVTPHATNVNYRVSTPRFTYVGEIDVSNPTVAGARFSPTGNVSATVETVLVSTGEYQTGFDRTAIYDVVTTHSSITQHITHTVDPAEMGVLKATYRRTGTDQPYDLALATDTGGPRERYFDHVYRGYLGYRTNQTIYVSAPVEQIGVHLLGNDSRTWIYGPIAPDTPAPASGSQSRVVKNAHPLSTEVRLSIDETTETVSVSSRGYRSRTDTLRDDRPESLAIAVNETVISNKSVTGPTTIDASVTTGDVVEITATGRTDAFALSRKTVTKKRFTYDPAVSYDPPAVRVTSIRNETANGSTTLGIGNHLLAGQTAVTISVDRGASEIRNVTVAYAENATVEYPFTEAGLNESTAWKPTNLTRIEQMSSRTRYEAEFNSTAIRGPVSLAIRVTTANGSVTERVTMASFRILSSGSTIESKPSIPLDITVNDSTIVTDEPVTFTVRRTDTGSPVNASVTIGNSSPRWTGRDGELVDRLSEPGTVQVVATKPSTNETAFRRDERNVTAHTPANFMESFGVNATTLPTDRPLGIRVTVTNTGDLPGNRTVRLTVDGTIVASKELRVNGHESRNYTFAVPLEQGERNVSLTSVSANISVTVLPAVDVRFDERMVTIERNDTVQRTLGVGQVTQGIGAFNLTLTSRETGIARIASVTVHGSPATINTSSKNGSVTVAASGLDTNDTGSVRLVTVTLVGEEVGETALTGALASIKDESGETRYYPVSNGQVTVRVDGVVPLENASRRPTDPDSDDLFEDVNGDGNINETDVEMFFRHYRLSTVTNHATYYDFNGDGTIDVLDVQQLLVDAEGK